MYDRVVLIDGNHLMHRAFWKFKNLKTFDGIPTSIIYGAPYVLESLIRRLHPDKLIVVFDANRSQYRKDILPGYKERESRLGNDKENFHEQKEVLIKLLQAFGVQVYRKEGYEADDIIAYLSIVHFRKGWEVIIATGDKDFVQLINRRISLYHVNKGKMVDEFTAKDFFGYTAKECVEYLSLLGDSSDKIPGYPGIGPKKARQILDKWGSVKKFLKSEDKFGKVDKVQLKEVMDRNYKLIDLLHFVRKILKKEDMVPLNPVPTLDMPTLETMLATYQINSFKKAQFLNTYKNLSYDFDK